VCQLVHLLPICYLLFMTLASTLTEKRKQGAMDEIARAALELFTRDGFDATSVEAIAAAAGCAPRTFYRYFGTKEDVMFHDLPAMMEQLGLELHRHLAAGLGPWQAVSELLVGYIGRFDSTDERILTDRMSLWLNEPALRARYMQYFNEAERVIADALHQHRRTVPKRDDLPQLVAVASIGAYRVTLLTHIGADGRKLTRHLTEALATLGDGLGDEVSPMPAAGIA
jgi:TetR/AcrR family transcriptional regulator, regulator of mycofactocin system